MPRLSPLLLRSAASQNTFLPRLLRECRDLRSAENELRWLTEFVQGNHDLSSSCSSLINNNNSSSSRRTSARRRLGQYVDRRSRGEPLQYILGSQPFGDLDILCRPGTLIPRPETETYTTNIAELIISAQRAGHLCNEQRLAIADLCTGTGCIALLLHSRLRPASTDLYRSHSVNDPPTRIHILGADVSSKALDLAQDNLAHNLSSHLLQPVAKTEIEFHQLDVLALGREAAATGIAVQQQQRWPHLAPGSGKSIPRCDSASSATKFLSQRWPVIISNPPYISPHDYAPGGTTARSVREYEPKLALVPPDHSNGDSSATQPFTGLLQADTFYSALLAIAAAVDTELLVMEVGDLTQAMRVVKLATKLLPKSHRSDELEESSTNIIEIWKDDGSVVSWDEEKPHVRFQGASDDDVNTRAVAVWRGSAAAWRSLSS